MYILLLLLLLIPTVTNALDITSTSQILVDENKISAITDDKESTYQTISSNSIISIKSETPINGIYIIYERESKTGTLTSENEVINVGTNGFLHEYIQISKSTSSLSLTYDSEVKIADIYVLSDGELPDYVEVWNEPCKQADLLLFSTHSDDEQLFFLGLLPTYVARGAYTQVVYFTNHYDNTQRLHEQLHGLYTVGIRNYPIIGIIPDKYSETLEGAIKNINNAGLTEADALAWEVEMIRRFKPSVIVGHDELGEYSHGQHILNTYILEEAIIKANDSSFDIDTYNEYGVWDTPKTYLHLYKENQIVMNYDEPLAYFGGKTAYEVSKEGYKKHLSQQWTWFTSWINGKNNEYTKASDIKTYSPLEFGLYRSTVGLDEEKNDMFENLTLLKDVVEDIPSDEKTLDETNEKEEKINFNVYKYVIAGIIIILLILISLLSKRKKVLKK